MKKSLAILFLLLMMSFQGCEFSPPVEETIKVAVVFFKHVLDPCPNPGDCSTDWTPETLKVVSKTPRHKADEWIKIFSEPINDYFYKATYGQVGFDFDAIKNPDSADGFFDAPHAIYEYDNGSGDMYQESVEKAYSVLGDGLAEYDRLLIVQSQWKRCGVTVSVHKPTPYYPLFFPYTVDGKTFTMQFVGVCEDVTDQGFITILSHELGHVLGAPDQYQDGTGDFTGMGPWDLMGYDQFFNHFGAWTKLDRDWISWTDNTTRMPCVNDQCEITTVLDPLEMKGNNALLIPYMGEISGWFGLDFDEFIGLMAECRMMINGDENIPEAGVLLSQSNPYLDQNWQIAISQVKTSTNNFLDAALEPGEVYIDTARNIRVTNLSEPGDSKCTVKAETGIPAGPDLLIRQGSVELGENYNKYISPDIWIDNSLNGWHAFSDSQNPEWVSSKGGTGWIPDGIGDSLIINELNQIIFRIFNIGTAAAEDITVRVYVRQLSDYTLQSTACGAEEYPYPQAVLPVFFDTLTINDLGVGESYVAFYDNIYWTPDSNAPVEIEVTIDSVPGESNIMNNTAYQTLHVFKYPSGVSAQQPAEVGDFSVHLAYDCLIGMPFWILPLEAETPWEILVDPDRGFLLPGESAEIHVSARPGEDVQPGDCSLQSVGVFFQVNDVVTNVGEFPFIACLESGAATEVACRAPVITFSQRATCRYGPGTAYAALAYVEPGEALTVEGRSEDSSWLYVHTSEGVACWVSSSVGTVEGDRGCVAVREAPPLPTPTPSPSPVPFNCSQYTSMLPCLNDTRCTWVGASCVNK